MVLYYFTTHSSHATDEKEDGSPKQEDPAKSVTKEPEAASAQQKPSQKKESKKLKSQASKPKESNHSPELLASEAPSEAAAPKEEPVTPSAPLAAFAKLKA